MKYLFTSLISFVAVCGSFAQNAAICSMTRQSFSILDDSNATTLGAELLVGEYSTNASFKEILDTNGKVEFEKAPEFLVIKQAMLFGKGDIEGALADFLPAEKEKARNIYVDADGLRKAYSNYISCKFISKSQFGALTHIIYKSALTDGHHLTVSEYLIYKDGEYKFLTEPKSARLFALVAASFSGRKSGGGREIPKTDQSALINLVFKSGDANDNNSDIVLKCRPETVPGDPAVSQSEDPLAKFLGTMFLAYKTQNASQIKSLWGPDVDADMVQSMIDDHDFQASGEYYKKNADMKIAFYIKSNEYYWVYIYPTGNKDQLKLVQLRKSGPEFKLTNEVPDPIANAILSDETIVKSLLQQL